MTAAELHAAVRALVDETVLPNVEQWDREDAIPEAAFDALLETGISRALVPVAHGGAGLGVADLVPAWRTLSQGWISLTGAVNPTALASTLLARNGTPQQQARWLPGIASGELVPAIAMTEPGEVAAHPHVAARGTVVEVDGVPRAAPAPRFSRTPAAPPGAPVPRGADVAAIIDEWSAGDR